MNPLKKLNLKQQLILLFLIMVSPIILLNWYGNLKAEQILKRHVTNAYVELNKQNHYLIKRDIDTVNRIMTTIIQNPVTQQLIPDDKDTVLERVNKYKAMDKLLGSYSLGVGGGEAVYYSFFVYDPDDLYSFVPKTALTNIADSGVYFFKEGAAPNWFDEVVERKGKGYLKVIDHFAHSSELKTLAHVRAVNN
ncbi:MAG: sensor histidine kinase, partial [Gorillibacterium sp.]|nr:sensor histidine kinase [Gorillibacterium sp.]